MHQNERSTINNEKFIDTAFYGGIERYEAMMFGEYREASGTSHNRNIMRSLHESRTKLSADGDLILELPLKFDRSND